MCDTSGLSDRGTSFDGSFGLSRARPTRIDRGGGRDKNRGLKKKKPNDDLKKKDPFAKTSMIPEPVLSAVDLAAAEERKKILRRKGRSSTIISGGSGITGAAPLSRPQALGA